MAFRRLSLCLLLVAGGSIAHAQTAVPAPPAQASGIVGLVQMAAGAVKACKAKICACPLGQLITNAAKPMNLLAGGLLCPPCCPPINPNDLKKPPTSAQGACAKIMQEEMEAPARRKAIQCLAYADCKRFPEAEAALIGGLRADPNECVRLEAAFTLGRGCCCTKKTIEALALTVSGSNSDGNPVETSERVKAAALESLQRCLCTFTEPVEPKRPEKPVKPAAPSAPNAMLTRELQPVVYYYRMDQQSTDAVLANARRIVDAAVSASQRANTTPMTRDGRSLYQLWVNARSCQAGNAPARTAPVAQGPN